MSSRVYTHASAIRGIGSAQDLEQPKLVESNPDRESAVQIWVDRAAPQICTRGSIGSVADNAYHAADGRRIWSGMNV